MLNIIVSQPLFMLNILVSSTEFINSTRNNAIPMPKHSKTGHVRQCPPWQRQQSPHVHEPQLSTAQILLLRVFYLHFLHGQDNKAKTRLRATK